MSKKIVTLKFTRVIRFLHQLRDHQTFIILQSSKQNQYIQNDDVCGVQIYLINLTNFYGANHQWTHYTKSF